MRSAAEVFEGGGDMGERLRNRDWTSTSLGPPDAWPDSLKFALRLVLNTPVPMAILWGKEAVSLYNDAYVDVVGPVNHRSCQGLPASKAWPDAWAFIEPRFSAVMRGDQGVPMGREPLPLALNRGLEAVYQSYSFNPIEDGDGDVGGVLIVAGVDPGDASEDRVRESAQRQRTTFDHMSTFAAILTGPDHVYTYVNESYRRLFGERDYLGRSVGDLYTKAESERFLERLDHVYASKTRFRGRSSPIRLFPSHEDRFADLVYQPLYDDKGETTGILVAGYDITDLVWAEAQQRAAEARQRFLLTLGDRLRDQRTAKDAVQVGVDEIAKRLPISRVGYAFVADDEATIAYQSQRTAPVMPPRARLPLELFGAESVAGLRGGRTVVCNDLTADPAMASVLVGQGIASMIIVPLVREEGLRALFYLNDSEARVWSLEDIELAEQVAARIWDAVDRAGAEEALRRSQQRQAFLFDLIWRQRNAVDDASVMQTAAQALGRHLSAARTGFFELFDDQAMTFVSGWSGGRLPQIDGVFRIADFGQGLRDQYGVEPMVYKDARVDPVASGSVFAKSGAVAGVVVSVIRRGRWAVSFFADCDEPRDWLPYEIELVRDVAEATWDAVERLRARADLEDTHAHLADRVAKALSEHAVVEEALRQSQKLEAVGQLTGGVAHDFNNLLTVIRSSSDFLRRPNLTEERRARYISAISDTADRAAKLTGQLLAFARRQTLQPEIIDVGASIKAVRMMVATLAGSGIRLLIEETGEPLSIEADLSQFETSLVNIAVNARDAMQGQGVLTLSVHGVADIPAAGMQPAILGSYVAISIRDTGSGISPEHMEKLFEPFFTTKAVGQGTGLGLSQVFGFAKQSGGEVRVKSEVGKGATFTIYLPRVDAQAPNTALAPPHPLGLADGEGLCVLVVEDNADVGRFTTDALAELGYETVWAANAADALLELDRGIDRFDVVFSDVVMPGMNGIELGLAINRRSPDLPVVLCSGYSHVLAENGTFGFELLHKPYSIEQLSNLLIRTSAARRSTAGPPHPALRYATPGR